MCRTRFDDAVKQTLLSGNIAHLIVLPIQCVLRGVQVILLVKGHPWKSGISASTVMSFVDLFMAVWFWIRHTRSVILSEWFLGGLRLDIVAKLSSLYRICDTKLCNFSAALEIASPPVNSSLFKKHLYTCTCSKCLTGNKGHMQIEMRVRIRIRTSAGGRACS